MYSYVLQEIQFIDIQYEKGITKLALSPIQMYNVPQTYISLIIDQLQLKLSKQCTSIILFSNTKLQPTSDGMVSEFKKK